MRRLRIFGIASVALIACAGPRTLAGAGDAPAAALRVEGDPVQPAEVPVVLTLTVENVGALSLSYWCAGPGDYPDSDDFVATVIRAGPEPTEARVRLSNGQTAAGGGHAVERPAGRRVRFPAALGPLPAGRYEITVEGPPAGASRKASFWM